jgi:hypothetical protein
MFGRKKNKGDHRYYLLPGMGRSNRHHRKIVFRWALIVAIIFSIGFGLVLAYVNRR